MARVKNKQGKKEFNMFKELKYTLLAAILCLATANAGTLAVLEITIADDEIDLAVDETKFLSDELRRQAIRILPKDYSVLSREKIITLIPETAENLKSVVDIGMVIKSDYVTRGYIGKVGNLLTLTVELYETSSGNMLGDFVKESKDLKGFLDAIRENAPDLFAKITRSSSIPTNIPAEPKKGNTSFWVAVGLDVLGATAIGLGIYNNSKAGDHHKESQKLMENVPNEAGQYSKRETEFKDSQQKMEDAKTMRNIFYITGGALLAGGIAVHIWF
ncbi:MAG: hypothetical protein LBC64_06545 [Fibromonadaceae bacterium]|nr:hypothetical protein [Fibromonadaceae bacterium]